MNRRDRGYRADDCGRITEFKETNGQGQDKRQRACILFRTE